MVEELLLTPDMIYIYIMYKHVYGFVMYPMFIMLLLSYFPSVSGTSTGTWHDSFFPARPKQKDLLNSWKLRPPPLLKHHSYIINQAVGT